MSMDTNKVIDIIRNNNLGNFLRTFIYVDDLIAFKDKETGNNIFHLIAMHADVKKAKAIYNAYSYVDKPKIDALLLQRNNDGALPASHTLLHKENQKSYSVSNLSENEKRIKDTYTYLKRMTKKALNSNPNQNLYALGEVMPGSPLAYRHNIGERGFSTYIPVYPTIRLVKHQYDQTRKKGLSDEENNTSFINFEERTPTREGNIEKNIGEFVELRNIPITTRPLSEQVKKMLNFPEDFEYAFKTLDNFGYEVRSNLDDSLNSTLIKNFTSRGGVVIIEDKELQYMNSSLTTEKQHYSGLSHFKFDSSKAAAVPIIHLNSGRIIPPVYSSLSILNHELSHSSDRELQTGMEFSILPISKLVIPLYSTKKNIPNELGYYLYNTTQNYNLNSFFQESLANFTSFQRNDELIGEYSKLFKNYTDAYKNGDIETFKLIASLDENNFPNGKMIKDLSDSFQENLKNNSLEKFYKEIDRDLIEKELIPSFVSELKDLNKTIDLMINNPEMSKDTSYKAAAAKDLLFNKTIGIPEEHKIKEAFEKTEKEMDEAQSIKNLNNLLGKKLNAYANSDKSDITLFEIGLVSTKIKQNLAEQCVFFDLYPEFNSPDDFKNINSIKGCDGPQKMKKSIILRQANKINRELTDYTNYLADKPLSGYSLYISLNTNERTKNIQKARDNVSKLTKASKEEALDALSLKVKEFSRKTTYSVADMIELIGTATHAHKKNLPEQELPKTIDIYEINLQDLQEKSSSPVIQNPDFKKALDNILKLKNEFYAPPVIERPNFVSVSKNQSLAVIPNQPHVIENLNDVVKEQNQPSVPNKEKKPFFKNAINLIKLKAKQR